MNKQKVRSAVVGVGYLGKFHAEKYQALEAAELVAVCDSDIKVSRKVGEKHDVLALDDYTKLLGKIDAVTISVPTPLHYQVASFFLKNGVHVLLEKPIAVDLKEADELIAIAKRNRLAFHIGHLERFNPVFKKVKLEVKKPLFIEAVRLAPFKSRGSDVDVVFDLMIHDLDLILQMVPSHIKRIETFGMKMVSEQIDVANAYLTFENGCVANLVASRVNPELRREMRIYEQNRIFYCDLQNKNLIISTPDFLDVNGVNSSKMLDKKVELSKNDALAEEVAAFVKAIFLQTGRFASYFATEQARNALAMAMSIKQQQFSF